MLPLAAEGLVIRRGRFSADAVGNVGRREQVTLVGGVDKDFRLDGFPGFHRDRRQGATCGCRLRERSIDEDGDSGLVEHTPVERLGLRWTEVAELADALVEFEGHAADGISPADVSRSQPARGQTADVAVQRQQDHLLFESRGLDRRGDSGRRATVDRHVAGNRFGGPGFGSPVIMQAGRLRQLGTAAACSEGCKRAEQCGKESQASLTRNHVALPFWGLVRLQRLQPISCSVAFHRDVLCHLFSSSSMASANAWPIYPSVRFRVSVFGYQENAAEHTDFCSPKPDT